MPSYTAIVELDGAPHTEDEIDALMDRLSAFHVTVGESIRRNPQITLTIDGATLAAASQAAHSLIESADSRVIASSQIMFTHDFDKTGGVLEVPPLLSVSEVAERLGITRQAVMKRITTGSLPATKIGNAWVVPEPAVEAI